MTGVHGSLVELNGLPMTSQYSLAMSSQLMPFQLPLQSLTNAAHVPSPVSQLQSAIMQHGCHRIVSAATDDFDAPPLRQNRHEHHHHYHRRQSRSPSPASRDADRMPASQQQQQERHVRTGRQSCEDTIAVVGNSRRTSSSIGGKNSFLINDILGVVSLSSDIRRGNDDHDDDGGTYRGEQRHSSSTRHSDAADSNRSSLQQHHNAVQSRKFGVDLSILHNTAGDMVESTIALSHSTSPETNKLRPFRLPSSENEAVRNATGSTPSIDNIQARLTSAVPLLSSSCHGDLTSSVVVSSNKTPLPSTTSAAVRPIPMRPSDQNIGFENCVGVPNDQQSVYHQLQAAAAGLTTPSAGSQHRQMYAMHHHHQQQQQLMQQPVHNGALPVHPGSVYGHHHNHGLVMPHIPSPSFMGLGSDPLQTAAAAAAFYLNSRHSQLLSPCEFPYAYSFHFAVS